MTEPLSLDDLAVMENGYGYGSIFDMRNPSRPIELNEDDLVDLVKRLIHHEPHAMEPAPVVAPAPSPPTEGDKVVDLMAALEASVAAAKDARRRRVYVPPTIDLPDPED